MKTRFPSPGRKVIRAWISLTAPILMNWPSAWSVMMLGWFLCSAFRQEAQPSQGGSRPPQLRALAKTDAVVFFPTPSMP